ncbi:MAG: radical SAM protein [Phycisphaerales bacterium]|nr:radical SAM protein [Phycisphaerales bacterium]
MTLDISRHPCFNGSCKDSFGRIHLPVAPRCNVQCNFCNRKYDCVNESRPGVTSGILSPGQAVEYLSVAMDRNPALTVVGIAGPGDPFADPHTSMETLRRVRARWPELLLCVATNGLGLEPHVQELAALQTTHVTITISAVDPAIAGGIYTWVRAGHRALRGIEAGRLMVERQLAALQAVKSAGMIAKVNCIVIPGINDQHVLEVAARVKALGADILNLMGLCHVPGTPFEQVVPPCDEEIGELRTEAGAILPQMLHCSRCRADAAGLIGGSMPEELLCCLQRVAAGPLEPEQERPYIAVASLEGVLVNQHLGEAKHLRIFERIGPSAFRLLEHRPTPPPGGGCERWRALSDRLHDCRALLCGGAGSSPVSTCAQSGLRVIVMEGLIEDALKTIYGGGMARAPLRKHTCGSGCSGNGTGCS